MNVTIDFDYEMERQEYDLNQENEYKKSIPPFLFKYKSVHSAIDLDRLLDIINNSHIYMPTYEKLNDPLEGTNTRLLSVAEEIRDEERKKWQILALSEDCLLPTLWAYYSGNYTGVCLGFKTHSFLDNEEGEIEKVKYVDGQQFFTSDEQMDLKEDLTIKNECWSYEKEWRIIRKACFDVEKNITNSYFVFPPEDMVHILIGYKMPGNVINAIEKCIPETTQLWIVKPSTEKYCLFAENKKDGRIIHTMKELS